MTVGMAAIQLLGEHSIGNRGRQIAELKQPMHAQVAHAIDFPLLEARPQDHVGHQLEAAIQESLQRRQANNRGVVADIGVELRADAAQRFVDVEGRILSAALIEHVGGDRGQPRPLGGVGGCARRHHAAAR